MIRHLFILITKISSSRTKWKVCIINNKLRDIYWEQASRIDPDTLQKRTRPHRVQQEQSSPCRSLTEPGFAISSRANVATIRAYSLLEDLVGSHWVVLWSQRSLFTIDLPRPSHARFAPIRRFGLRLHYSRLQFQRGCASRYPKVFSFR